MTEFTERAMIAMLRRIERNTLLIEAQGLDIEMNQAEMAEALVGIGESLAGVGTQLGKAQAEIVAAIAAAGNSTPAVDAALANLQAVSDALAAASQSLDDLNPDAA